MITLLTQQRTSIVRMGSLDLMLMSGWRGTGLSYFDQHMAPGAIRYSQVWKPTQQFIPLPFATHTHRGFLFLI